MDNPEIISIFQSSYNDEYNKFLIPFEEAYKSAPDKFYTVQWFYGLAYLAYIFRTKPDLDQEIISSYEHVIKLGGTIQNVIEAIPDIIDMYKRSEEIRKRFEPKQKNKVIWKKLFGIIPYEIESIRFLSDGKLGSHFESLITKEEIAAELGVQRAQLDLFDFFKVKYVEHGGKLNADAILPEKEIYKLAELRSALENYDLEKFFSIIQKVFATFSYNMKVTEGYFHSHIHFMLSLLDCNIKSEVETNIGRIDSVVETENYIYIFEFKRGSSQIAIDQIINKKYFQQFSPSAKKIILVGVAIDTNERNIVDWKAQSYN